MNNDTSFIELTYPDNLLHINIDPRLVSTFTNVMYRMQAYFNKHNYTKHFNYRELFKEYVMCSDQNKKLKIWVNSELKNIKMNGCYWESINCIELGSCTDTIKLEQTLCHEFIHFLTDYTRKKRWFKVKDCSKKHYIKFIGEALTEMLSLEIYPEYQVISGYEANVRMMEFANRLCGNINHYQSFLLGHLDIKIVNWWKKTPEIEKYENDFYHYVEMFFQEEKRYTMNEALVSQNYLYAQRSIILACLEKINSFDEYFEFITKVIDAPLRDYEFLKQILLKKEKKLIDKLQIKDGLYSQILLNDLINLRNDIIVLNRKSIDLPFNNGFIEFFSPSRFYTYMNNSAYATNKGLNRISVDEKNGVYYYDYQVDYVFYHKVVNKMVEYQNYDNSYNLFKKHLSYLTKDGKVKEGFYQDGIYLNNYYVPNSLGIEAKYYVGR